MTFSQQQQVLKRLAGREHFDKDKELLARKVPASKLLKTQVNYYNVQQVQEQILWELIKAGVTEQEITENRTGVTFIPKSEQHKEAVQKAIQAEPEKKNEPRSNYTQKSNGRKGKGKK